MYDPYGNNCITLTDQISVSDIDCILNETEDKKNVKIKKPTTLYESNIACHRGKMDETNKSCICDDGWTSSQNWNFPIVSTVPVYMCTVQMHTNHSQQIDIVLLMLKNLRSKNFVSFIHT